MLIYSPLCDCCSVHFWELDGGLAHHLSIGEDALSDVLVSTCYHCEARHPHSVTTHRIWVESTEPCEDGLHHSVAVGPLCSPARLHTPQYYQVQQNPKIKDNLGTFDSSNEYKYSHESAANITQILLTHM